MVVCLCFIELFVGFLIVFFFIVLVFVLCMFFKLFLFVNLCMLYLKVILMMCMLGRRKYIMLFLWFLWWFCVRSYYWIVWFRFFFCVWCSCDYVIVVFECDYSWFCYWRSDFDWCDFVFLLLLLFLKGEGDVILKVVDDLIDWLIDWFVLDVVFINSNCKWWLVLDLIVLLVCFEVYDVLCKFCSMDYCVWEGILISIWILWGWEFWWWFC